MRIATILFAAAVSGFVPAMALAADATTPATTPPPAASTVPDTTSAPAFTDAQRTAIEAIVHDYLVKEHPEVIREGADAYEKTQEDVAEQKTEDAVTKDHDKIFSNPDSPVGGNPNGDVTIVEFYDYNCGYCKMSEPSVEKILKEDKKVKFIYKEFPILGPESLVAAHASVAASKQSLPKFIAFHDALMSSKEHLSDDLIYKVAKDAGLNVDQLKKDMNDMAINSIVNASVSLGSEVGVRGTPMFIFNDHIYPGAIQSYDQMKKMVDQIRSGTAPAQK